MTPIVQAYQIQPAFLESAPKQYATKTWRWKGGEKIRRIFLFWSLVVLRIYAIFATPIHFKYNKHMVSSKLSKLVSLFPLPVLLLSKSSDSWLQRKEETTITELGKLRILGSGIQKWHSFWNLLDGPPAQSVIYLWSFINLSIRYRCKVKNWTFTKW